jgi:hypothetical protein
MKLYFASYLGVHGEIKEGDLFLRDSKPSIHQFLGIKSGNLGKYKIIQGYTGEEGKKYEGHIVNHINCPKVKLYICSRDIKAGDSVRFRLAANAVEKELKCVDDFMDVNIHGDDMKTVVLEDGDFKVYTTPDRTNQCYKIIGLVSPNAIWVKHGDEFDKEELLQHGVGVNLTANGGTVKIKCSQCNTYH